jgi:hypothetical protein
MSGKIHLVFCLILAAAFCGGIMASPSAALAASASGTTIPGTSAIIDANGNTWTVSGGVIYKNGSLAGYSKSVTELVYNNDVIYQENTAGNWWSWNGSGWVDAAAPAISSAPAETASKNSPSSSEAAPPDSPKKPAANAACGSSDGAVNLSVAPTTNLCSSGSPSQVVGNGPYYWNCSTSDGSSFANCGTTVKAANGSCGSADGASFNTTPTSNLCSSGTVGGFVGKGPWYWNCAGIRGGATVNCGANYTATPQPVAVNGACGTSNGTAVSTIPNANLCSTGTTSSVTGSGPWAWSCAGTNGGTNATCSAPLKPVAVNGTCGTTLNTCAVGTVSNSSDNGTTTIWNCSGSNGGTVAACSMPSPPKPINGMCGSANGSTISGAPTTNLCSTGASSSITGNGPWAWSCAGSNGGANANCSAALAKPTESPSGTNIPPASKIIDNGGNAWTVSGGVIYKNGSLAGYSNAVIELVYINGVIYQQNTAKGWWSWSGAGWVDSTNPVGATTPPAATNGTCGTSNGTAVSTIPNANLCSTGTTSSVTGSGPWAWSCAGTNGGTNATCSAPLKPVAVNGTCGTSNGTAVSTIPNANLCSTGTTSSVTGSGPWAWSCAGTNGGTNATCSAPLKPVAVNGACGTSAGSILTSAPTLGLCSVGSASSVTGGGPWAWSCAGTNGGANANCSASLQQSAMVNGVCSPVTGVCNAGTATSISNNGTTTTWMCTGSNGGATATCNTIDNASNLAGSKMGINLDYMNDWADRNMMFVDVMKNARPFSAMGPHGHPNGDPVPVNANGWPTTDFGTIFLSVPEDPLNRPLSQTYPSMAGTYHLSFTGTATVAGTNCCQIQNVNYNATTNTTTADVVVSPTDTFVGLFFSKTNKGVQNIKLLRPGYPLGTTQVFTTQFLKAIAPFSTVRFLNTLGTNNNVVFTWDQRTLPTDPQQSDWVKGVAWEYIIQFANTTGKDIWINIPEHVNVASPYWDNYVTQLAKLLKATLNPNIHVYVEYSNEVWNFQFQQAGDNMNSAIAEVTSGADPTLNYDHVNNEYYWGYRRVVHQTVRISQIFKDVYGAAAMNTIIRPVFMSLYVNPFLAEDGLLYLKNNFGPPNQYIYAVGGAPYFGEFATNIFSNVNDLFAELQSGVNGFGQIISGFSGQSYNGGVVYQNYVNGVPQNNISYKALADYYGIKSIAYEGGPINSDDPGNAVISELGVEDPRMGDLVQKELAHWFGCGNDLFVYYSLATPPGNSSGGPWGAYLDITVPTQKSKALEAVAATPLANLNTCSSH